MRISRYNKLLFSKVFCISCICEKYSGSVTVLRIKGITRKRIVSTTVTESNSCFMIISIDKIVNVISAAQPFTVIQYKENESKR